MIKDAMPTLYTKFQILIEGVIGGGSSGDIAIDDITVLTGSCIKIVKQGKLNLKKVQSQNGTAKYV